MKESPYMGEVLVPGVDPYNEQLTVEVRYLPFQQTNCPVCGSSHSTRYRKLMSNNSMDGMLSGDLSLRTIMVVTCLHCGHTRTDRFRMVRDV